MNGNTKNIIIIVLAFLVIGLVVIVGLFATNTIYVDKKSKINLKGTATKEEVTTETKEKVKLTKNQALEISSNLIKKYFEFNYSSTRCGEVNEKDSFNQSSGGLYATYKASTKYKTEDELLKDLKEYFSDSIIENSLKKSADSLDSLLEYKGKLYCKIYDDIIVNKDNINNDSIAITTYSNNNISGTVKFKYTNLNKEEEYNALFEIERDSRNNWILSNYTFIMV